MLSLAFVLGLTFSLNDLRRSFYVATLQNQPRTDGRLQSLRVLFILRLEFLISNAAAGCSCIQVRPA